MVQFLSINFFLGFLQFLLGFSKVPVFLCHLVYERCSITECHKQLWKQVWEEVVISGKSECGKSHNMQINNSAFEGVGQFRYLGITLTCQKILFWKKLRGN